jgi:TonB-dependent receptor
MTPDTPNPNSDGPLHRALRRCRLVPVLLLALPLGAAPAADVGSIHGRVFNAASGQYVNNARVIVDGTSLQTFTNDTGDYLLRNVPAGAERIKVSYAGQKDLVETVTVERGADVGADFTFNAADAKADASTVKLDRYVIESSRYRNAQELATNEERVSTNIKAVVALDSLGYVSDGNVGEFVRFLPGVDVSNNGPNPDDAASVSVRGFGSDSTAVLVDGVPIASGSPNSLTRSVQLDGLSINNASRLEVIKVATPDMPQNSPGGAINLITRGAFELPHAVYNLSLAFNGNTQTPQVFKRTPGPYGPSFKTLPSVRFSATIPVSKKVGVSFSVASDNKYSLTRSSSMRDWFYSGKTTTASGVTAPVANAKGGIRIDNPLIDRFELNEYQWLEYRQSGNLRVDYRPFPGLEIRANGQFSQMQNTGVSRRTQWRYSNATGVKDWGDDFVQGFQRTSAFNPRDQASMTIDARDREGFTSQGYLSVRYRLNGWALDGNASASESFNGAPDRANGHFSSVDGSITPGRMDLVGVNKGVVGKIMLWDAQGNPIDYGSLSAWDPIVTNGFRARSSEAYNRDLSKQYKLDLTRELDFRRVPTTVKIGAMQNEKSNHRWGNGATYEMRYIGPTIPNREVESAYASEPTFGYATPQHWVDPEKIYNLYTEHPEYFDDQFFSPTLNVDSRAANYLSRIATAKSLTETTTDWYGMVTSRFFHNRLTVLAGARQSRKHRQGYNVFNDPTYQYVKNADGTVYRDSIYTTGVRFDGNANSYPVGDPRRDPSAVLTDAALRGRMQAAGIAYLPTQLELAPNGTPAANFQQNLVLAHIARTTRYVDAKQKEPWTPQLQLAYDITENLKVQAAWSRETRLPDLEGTSTSLLVSGASFQVNQNLEPTSDLGGDGTITLANLGGMPEINDSYNFKLSWYPQNGSGRYSVSYYYKVVKNAWQTFQAYNTDNNYDALLESMGLSRDEYPNYRIDTVLPHGGKDVRKGFEIEAVQNMGALASWARGIDVFLTYTRRPVVANTGGEARLGWIPLVPVRAKWTGGVSYSARRYRIQSKFTYTESGITYSGSGNSVTMPDGTTKTVQLYNMNVNPAEVNVQANYFLNKHTTLFAVANRVLSARTYGRIADAMTGMMPGWATWRTVNDRGVQLSAGVEVNF